MIKILHTGVFLLLTTLVYGQKSTLFQNINFRAKELKHSLNKAGDSLILEGERTISKVEIFNSDYEQSIAVKDSKVKICLNDIPVGRFVVEATLPDKLIVITLLRNESLHPEKTISKPEKKTSLFGDDPITSITDTAAKKVTAPRLVVINKTEPSSKEEEIIANDKKSNIAISRNAVGTEDSASPKNNEIIIEESLTINRTMASNPGHKNVEAYWIVYKTNTISGGGTVKRFGDQALVERMIANINLDKKTKAGKHNELTIWEIYDVSKFVKYKMKKTNDLSTDKEFFNSKPYFKVEKASSKP
jgi:hypothetical protein